MIKQLLFITSLSFLISCSEECVNCKEISKNQFGNNWPLTIEKGYLSCNNGRCVTLRYEGKIYGLNGVAKTFYKNDPDYADINEIWANDTNMYGLKMSIAPLIEEGLKMCK
jgi:hypothetical protein